MAEEIAAPRQILPPPAERYTWLGWIQKNLFSTWYNSLLTFITLGLAYALLKPFLTWLLEQANWEVVEVNFRLLMVGQYPPDEIWRIWLLLYLLAAVVGLSWGVWVRGRLALALGLLLAPLLLALLPIATPSARLNLVAMDLVAVAASRMGRLGGPSLRRFAAWSWVIYLVLVILVVRGFALTPEVMPRVPTNLWGGLLLTCLLTVVGIVFSFPLGILLALGRRSSLPAIRAVSVVYIEVIRGVPLVTILFMAAVMVPFFLPSGITIDRVLRAMVGITLFSAAYLAENVRGGLQAVPHGQFEAASALGLSGFKTMTRIILPQALRIVIPVLMGQFIALFKDTTLVVTIGLLELLGIARAVLAQPQYVSYQREVYLFVAAIFWVISYLMSYISQRLESVLGVGER
ncbi:MAG TPA: amino acid ABC transporter permease [Anaerolineales bacterium]|nr:amino acid ABC transporter permease [Anaerolineales bacterium]